MIIFHIALLYISQILIIRNTMCTCPMSQDYFHASYLFFIQNASFLFAFGSIMSVALHCKSACVASQKYITMHFNRLPQTHRKKGVKWKNEREIAWLYGDQFILCQSIFSFSIFLLYVSYMWACISRIHQSSNSKQIWWNLQRVITCCV